MKAIIAVVSLSVAVWGQTNINGSRTIKGNLRVQGTTATIQSGTDLPAACSAGPPPDVFIRSTDNTYHYCSAANTWTMIAGGGGGGTSGTVTPSPNAVPKSGPDGKLATGWLPVMTGDSGSGGATGLVPAPGTGDGSAGKYLRADGTWATPPSAAGSLPDQGGNTGKLLSTNGSTADWRGIGSGLLVDSVSVKVDSAVVPMLGGLNWFSGTNTFTGTVNGTGTLDASGMALRVKAYTMARGAAPATPVSSEVALWADQATGKLSCKDSAGASCMPGGTFKIALPAARCESGSARVQFSTGSSSAPGATCLSSGSAVSAVAQFAAQQGSAQYVHDHFSLPDDWTGAIDLKVKWRTSATTNSVTWGIQTVCVGADGDAVNPTFNTASTISQSASTSSNGMSAASISGVTATGCAAGKELYWRLFRATNDTLAATADLIGLEFTIRRAW